VINDNPGLQPYLLDLIAHAYALAKLEASKQTGLDEGIFSDNCPWSLEQITDSSFFPD
jgi:hypothetical protein